MNPSNLNLEWQKTLRELIKIAGQLEHGEIVIKVQDKKPVITEYTVKRKTTDNSADILVRDLEDL